LRLSRDQAEKKAARAKLKAAKLATTEAKKKQAERDAKVAELSVVKTARDVSEKALVIREEPKFDLAGVSVHLKTERQISQFRHMVLNGVALKHPPVNQQAWLAKKVVELANERDQELTGSFIRYTTLEMILALGRDIRRDHGEKLENPDKDEDPWWTQHFSKDEQERTAEKIWTAVRALNSISELCKKQPKVKPISELKSAVNGACMTFNEFKSRFNL
jgi:hypothetical protein